jgi:hypothetical protein
MKKLTLFLTAFVFAFASYGQYSVDKVEQISFSGRVNAPVRIEVMRSGTDLQFYGINDSLFPYQLELEFRKFLNLKPYMGKFESILRTGKTRLFTLSPSLPNTSYDYSYTFRYALGDPSAKPDVEYPYLIPLNENKPVAFFRDENSRGMYNRFALPEGDTVFAMRKGIVTALPDHKKQVDRLLIGTLEILHRDGTVAAYENLNPEEVFVSIGETVLPGTPLGRVFSRGMAGASVYAFAEGYTCRPILFKYAVSENEAVPFIHLVEGTPVVHPITALEKELTKSEKKRRSKSGK